MSDFKAKLIQWNDSMFIFLHFLTHERYPEFARGVRHVSLAIALAAEALDCKFNIPTPPTQ
jgi:hypothetical protein